MYKYLFQINFSHYLGISAFGYQFEENGAFLPLLPWILRLFRYWPIRIVIQIGTWLFESYPVYLCDICLCVGRALQVSNRILSFLLSVLLFYKLSLLLLPQQQAYHATLFYIFSPATAHFNAVYTEALTASLSFLCLYQYIRFMTSKEISLAPL